MYKTVRQGENSLQYTILPQTEEVLCGSGMKGIGRDYTPYIRMTTRRRRRSGVAKFLLMSIFVTVVTVGLMIGSASLMAYYAQLQGKVNSPHETTNIVASVISVSSDRNDVPKSRKKELRISEVPAIDVDTASVETTAASTAPPTAVDRKTKPAWSMPAFKIFWKSSTLAPKSTSQMPIVEDQAELDIPNGPFRRYQQSKPQWDIIIRPTVSPKPTFFPTVTTQLSSFTRTELKNKDMQPSTTAQPVAQTATTEKDVLITTKWNMIPTAKSLEDYYDKNYPLGKELQAMKDSILDHDDDEGFRELEMDDKPKTPTADTKEMEEYYNRNFINSVSKTAMNMPKSWFLESLMSLLQWLTDPEDSFEMVLIAGTSLLLVVTLVAAVYLVRQRKENAKGSQTVGKLTADLQPDDKTNLLTVECQEEE